MAKCALELLEKSGQQFAAEEGCQAARYEHGLGLATPNSFIRSIAQFFVNVFSDHNSLLCVSFFFQILGNHVFFTVTNMMF